MTTKGNKWIKSGTIILIIIGILFLIYNVSGISGYKNMDSQMLADLERIGHMDTEKIISRMTIQAIGCGAQILIGIISFWGLKKKMKPALFGVMGAVVLLMTIGIDIYAFAVSGSGFETYLNSLPALIAAALLFIGTYKNVQKELSE